ncbi:Oidioi.mRNA.OKI2018_I69.XSR.g13878.t2.cds [Oikopleura dioica]|uniref:Oidioi.mRNA.OKI2018_I69.XSR.g13878.t2.cds n=1 Tax=Oikopleura dioica TaxID=34765 RepID=A0ABN7S9X0_OIKDI|nr:Oidioi.mRNA.OKI2018_I69.XSR.g13878.t2.cds [Oikopleura dioica]
MAASLNAENLALEAQVEQFEEAKAENCEVDAARMAEEDKEMMCAANENGSTSSNQPLFPLDPLEIREETEEEKKARLDMEEEVKKMLENLPPYVKRVVRTIKPLDESLHCKDCDVWVNSDTQMKQHLGSLRHKNTIAGIPVPPRPDKIEPVKPRSNHQYKCELCHVTLNSEVQLLQHLRSQRHKATLEGKPPKPRWVPYERFREQQRIQAKLKLQSAYAAAYQPILVPNFTHMQMGQLGQTQLGAMQNVQNVQGMALPPGMQFVQLM